jgi:actin-related protein
MIPPQLRPNSEKAQALRVVLAGGTASIPGFAELFRKKLESSNFPIKISDIFVPLEPLYVVSKGALQYAKTKIKK